MKVILKKRAFFCRLVLKVRMMYRFLQMNFSPSSVFFQNSCVSLKVCGVTCASDAQALAEMGIGAIGVNFWEDSKRYCSPESASEWLFPLSGRILRVGVFVNAPEELPRRMLEAGIIDLAQFHGDEDMEYCRSFARDLLPFIKAFGVKNPASLRKVADYYADAVLLDTPAPGVYGGTGSVFDWNLAEMFVRRHKGVPVFLAGGITVENALEAARMVRPAFLDIASGSESAPGVKDLDKCRRIWEMIKDVPRAHEEEGDCLNLSE